MYWLESTSCVRSLQFCTLHDKTINSNVLQEGGLEKAPGNGWYLHQHHSHTVHYFSWAQLGHSEDGERGFLGNISDKDTSVPERHHFSHSISPTKLSTKCWLSCCKGFLKRTASTVELRTAVRTQVFMAKKLKHSSFFTILSQEDSD